MQTVTRPGDSVVVETPTFYAALQALERLGLKAIELPAESRTGLDLAALARTLRRQRVAAAWLMPSFQNPLGSEMPTDHRRELVSLLAAHDVPLIEDDVYGELYHGAHAPLPAKAFDRKGLVMTCGSFSKCLAPGYRVGWVIGGKFATALERAKIMTTLSTAYRRNRRSRNARRLRAAPAAIAPDARTTGRPSPPSGRPLFPHWHPPGLAARLAISCGSSFRTASTR